MIAFGILVAVLAGAIIVGAIMAGMSEEVERELRARRDLGLRPQDRDH